MRTSIIYTVILLASLSLVLANFPPSSSGEENINTHVSTFRVDGMTCGTCALSIKIALKKLDGVVDVEVSYKKKEAKVFYEEGKVTVEQVVKAIKNVGKYKVRLIQDNTRTKGT